MGINRSPSRFIKKAGIASFFNIQRNQSFLIIKISNANHLYFVNIGVILRSVIIRIPQVHRYFVVNIDGIVGIIIFNKNDNITRHKMDKVTVLCSGGCGRTVTLRASKVQKADYYLCQSRESGRQCEQKLPPLQPGKVRRVEMNAAANFWGYTDELASEDDMASIIRAREILAAGVVQMALKTATK